ncbi:lysophospholipid acyltransferase family protein [Daejeonella oryzae]|uniref:lysophospholipid acyltransferase family protein n=1 Tax=Daejeonella oryzae TaxID=1122943 RepID=UPI0004008921|nr:lysophospholipid acyltransferase family protein [Daejeonella oryzae]
MNKILGYLFTPFQYLAFGLLLAIFHPIQWLALKIGGYKAHKKTVDILNLLLTGTLLLIGTRIVFKNEQNLPLNRPIIFIANHQSLYEIPPLIWYLRKYHAKFISKIELTKGIPSISFNLKYGGGANIDRKDSKQAVGEILKLSQRMEKNNWSAVIFPEGTRSRDGRLKPFAVGGIATLLKKAPHALLVPIAITGSWKIVQFGQFPLSFGEKMTITVLDPIEPEKRPLEDVVLIAENAVRNSIATK